MILSLNLHSNAAAFRLTVDVSIPRFTASLALFTLSTENTPMDSFGSA